MVGSWQAPFKAVLVPIKSLGCLSRTRRLAVQPHFLYFILLLSYGEPLFSFWPTPPPIARTHQPHGSPTQYARPSFFFFVMHGACQKFTCRCFHLSAFPTPLTHTVQGMFFFPRQSLGSPPSFIHRTPCASRLSRRASSRQQRRAPQQRPLPELQGAAAQTLSSL